MFFPPCNVCGSKNVESAEDDRIDQNARNMRVRYMAEAAMGHPHPVAKTFVGAVLLGRAVWKRWPGSGGLKRCRVCGNEFH